MLARFLVGAGVLIALAAAAAQFGVAAPIAGATGECQSVTGTLTSTANFNNFTTQGVISGDLEGTTFFQGDPSSPTVVTGSTFPPLNPTDQYTGDLTITTRQGVLTTRSVGVFEFIANGLGTQFDRVLGTQSSGKFAGASGNLFFNFHVNSALTGFKSTYIGQICN